MPHFNTILVIFEEFFKEAYTVLYSFIDESSHPWFQPHINNLIYLFSIEQKKSSP